MSLSVVGVFDCAKMYAVDFFRESSKDRIRQNKDTACSTSHLGNEQTCCGTLSASLDHLSVNLAERENTFTVE